MPEPLAGDEDRAADVEPERVVLERRAVPVAHQEADQPLVGVVHLRLAAGERDAGAVDDGEVVRHRPVEPHETVVEDLDGVVGDDLGHGHGRRTLAGIRTVPRFGHVQGQRWTGRARTVAGTAPTAELEP